MPWQLVGNIAGREGKDGAAGKDADQYLIAELRSHVSALQEEIKELKYRSSQHPTPEDVAAIAESIMAAAVAKLPLPKNGEDGKSLGPHDIAPMVIEEVAKAVAAVPKAKDGVGVFGALIDRTGQLVLTLSDGSVKELGVVVGRDGSVDMQDVSKIINDAIDKIPRPKDGAPGRDGTLESLKMVRTGDRMVTFCFKDGTPIEGGELHLTGLMLYRGVYVTEKSYEAGDAVTWAGSMWVAKETTTAKPGDGSTPWTLAVKAGRQGAIGPSGPQGIEGKKGKDGRDLTDLSGSGTWNGR